MAHSAALISLREKQPNFLRLRVFKKKKEKKKERKLRLKACYVAGFTTAQCSLLARLVKCSTFRGLLSPDVGFLFLPGK